MEQTELGLEDFVAYLDAIQELYPGGVPQRLVSDSVSATTNSTNVPKSDYIRKIESSKAVLLRGPGDVNRDTDALLQAAVVKGLGWKWSEVVELELGRISPRDVLRLLGTAEGSICLVLGNKAWDTLCNELPDQASYERGKEVLASNIRFVLTHELQPLCDEANKGSTQLKREFWQDLKLLRSLSKE